MPRHLFEGNPVDEGTKRRGTATLMHRSENPADTTDSSTSGLSPREPLERQAEFHSSTHKEDCLSCPNSAGTLRYKSEMESYTEIPDSTRDEAFFHCTKPSGVPRGPPTPQYPSPLRDTLGSSLRSPAEVEGSEDFLQQPEKDL